MTYRTTVSLDDDIEEDIQRDDRAFSELANEWARNYYVRGVPVLETMEADRVKAHLQNARDAYADAVEELDDAIALIEDAKETAESPREKPDADGAVFSLADAKEWWRGQPWTLDADPENPAMQEWADKLGMTPEEWTDADPRGVSVAWRDDAEDQDCERCGRDVTHGPLCETCDQQVTLGR